MCLFGLSASCEKPRTLSGGCRKRSSHLGRLQCCGSTCVAGTTWTTAFAPMCLWDFKPRPSPVPAFTSLHECCRYKSILWLLLSPPVISWVNCNVLSAFFPLIPLFQIPLPTRPHWYLLFGATDEEIKDICITTLKLYTRKKVRPV